jgi:ubiquinone/menaquinone biosynthesis C-methylase UbiE
VRLIERYVELTNRQILEIGAGEGRLTREIAARAASVLAVEPDSASVAVGRQMLASEAITNVSLRTGSAESLRLGEERFDVVLFSWSL